MDEAEEYELANKIKALIHEETVLLEKRGNGITLEKNEYVGDRLTDIEKELSTLKKLQQSKL